MQRFVAAMDDDFNTPRALALIPQGRVALRDARVLVAIAFGAAAWTPLLAWNLVSLGMLAASVEIIRRLWTEDKVTHRGRHWTFENVTIRPRPIRSRIGATPPCRIVRTSTLTSCRENSQLASKYELHPTQIAASTFLRAVSENAVLNANYLLARLKAGSNIAAGWQ